MYKTNISEKLVSLIKYVNCYVNTTTDAVINSDTGRVQYFEVAQQSD